MTPMSGAWKLRMFETRDNPDGAIGDTVSATGAAQHLI